MAIALLSAMLIVSSMGVAHAHPLLEAAATQAEDAAFEEALLSLESAWNAEALTREELVELTALRAVVHFALRAADGLAEDLALLAALDRAHVFGPHLPPALREQFERVVQSTEPARLESTLTFSAPFAVVEALVANFPAPVVKQVRIHGRADAGAWKTGNERQLVLPMPLSAAEWYVELIGPGGALLLRDGDMSSPRRATAPLPPVREEPVAFTVPPRREARRSSWYWWALGGGAAAAAVITAVAVVFTRDASSQTEVSGPVLR